MAIEVRLFKASRTVLEDTEGLKADVLVAGPKTVRERFSFQLTGTITNKDLVGIGENPIRRAFFKWTSLSKEQDS